MARGVARNHDEKRDAIRKGAADYFAKHGYDRASMTRAAKHCGVSKALIYHYYASKDALLFDILHSHLSELAGCVAQVASGPEYLRRLIHAILLAYRDADSEHKLQSDALGALAESERNQLIQIQKNLIQAMSDALLSESMEALDDPVRLHAVTMTVFGMLNWFYMWHRPNKGLTRNEYGDLLADMVMAGIKGL